MRLDMIGNRYAAGFLTSNLQDLERWDRSLRDHRLLREETQRVMWRPITIADGGIAVLGKDDAGRTLELGYGWLLSTVGGRRLVHHGGNIDGYSAQIDRYLDDDVTVIVLCNNEQGTATRVAAAIGDRWFALQGSGKAEP